jgi:hypothetical protein
VGDLLADLVLPEGPPRLAASTDGRWLAIARRHRLAIADAAAGGSASTLSLDEAGVDVAFGFVGEPARLLVVTRHHAHSLVRVVDPGDLALLRELRVGAPLALLGVDDGGAVCATPSGAVALTWNGELAVVQLAARVPPTAAAGIGDGRFLVNLAGTLEEWRLAERGPVRRFRLPRPITVRALGGTPRAAWYCAAHAPTRVELVPLGPGMPPYAHELPEPLGAAIGHPRAPVIAVVGAETRRVWLLDLTDRRPPQDLDVRADQLVFIGGDAPALLAATANTPPVLRRLPALASRWSPAAVGGPAAGPERIAGPASADEPAAPDASVQRTARVATVLDEWRQQVRMTGRGVGAAAPTPPPVPSSTWRDDLVAWGRGALAGGGPIGGFDAGARRLGELASAHDLDAESMRLLALLYAARLLGHDGLSPADAVRAVPGRWDVALGRGRLGELGLVRLRRGRLVLARQTAAALDHDILGS